MANRRNNIVSGLKTHLEDIASVEINNVYSSYRWIDELNDYPAITFVPRREARLHRGAGRKLAALVIELRGYVYNGDSAIADSETLAWDIEKQVQSFAESHRDYGVESALVVSVRTDEGLMHPYGVCDMTINITYDVDVIGSPGGVALTVDTTNITVDSTLITADQTRR